MNERIKELLLKAGFTNAYTDPQDGFELVFVDEDHTTQSVEKFAELIVRECVLEAMDAVHHNNSIRLQLYKHFGVE